MKNDVVINMIEVFAGKYTINALRIRVDWDKILKLSGEFVVFGGYIPIFKSFLSEELSNGRTKRNSQSNRIGRRA
ncbi:hypothetical protein DFP79_2260 [Marinomonas balearica]|uniref:Uncharacterized protein n=1 Tax=Marinomonas balearica TaxID=491947 RepID=A0A4R6M7Q0_9GAMM|nr:hypothetical protein DFP79_2260 [Marinomonas balearica]